MFFCLYVFLFLSICVSIPLLILILSLVISSKKISPYSYLNTWPKEKSLYCCYAIQVSCYRLTYARGCNLLLLHHVWPLLDPYRQQADGFMSSINIIYRQVGLGQSMNCYIGERSGHETHGLYTTTSCQCTHHSVHIDRLQQFSGIHLIDNATIISIISKRRTEPFCR